MIGGQKGRATLNRRGGEPPEGRGTKGGEIQNIPSRSLAFPALPRDAPHARLDLVHNYLGLIRGGAQRHAARHDAPCGGALPLANDEDGDAYRSDDSQQASTYAQRGRHTNNERSGSAQEQGPTSGRDVGRIEAETPHLLRQRWRRCCSRIPRCCLRIPRRESRSGRSVVGWARAAAVGGREAGPGVVGWARAAGVQGTEIRC